MRIVTFLALLLGLLAATALEIPGHKTTYEVTAEGEGELVVTPKASVTVHATGIVAETGKKFWSTKDKGQRPFSYTAGVKAVIVGWDMGTLGMKVGEKRMLTIPADEGYGKRGFPAWGIPPDGTLNFEIEVLSIAPAKAKEDLR
uniref:peptidylprolyl isomerase n=1 Tax=Calcidiscus leptoporus TaxID=127549 RepID=A0A7S0IWC5_9EUKA|mmetsp:Transcript_25824/g.60290  ORF Transcript_25824/g.60290 Transcript_25824/m.60290 type:complete len:144 (+) Transcript_25824:23-454(+)|eukprot:CAMPEP_0119374170 /NCGR_PEP_ID=MMETSP1334-20130426/29594_1 /TAXON_ID=127549 /ORGANISM="Calcidiscus leptoporus, Strain RCC1130" /LENGTH=143 /DNA_ID=CAMNT_0007392163 /DNA_START=23 /DNA_END=454 /DNA_ORIENTATION=+